MKLLITGFSGFVGRNIVQFYKDETIVKINMHNFNPNLIPDSVFSYIHLAGKAHDLKNSSNNQDYYKINTDLTKKIFDKFLESDAKVFIMLSSVKAVADKVESELTEDHIPKPLTHYGKSKLLAEQYIQSKNIPKGKRVYILRPCMIHGPENKGNLNLLYKIIINDLPWPLGLYVNKRSLCSIENLCFIINELIYNDKIPSGIYNISDDDPISTNDIIKIISKALNKKVRILNVPKFFIYLFSKFGDFFQLPLNSERLEKLTENYIVKNDKIKSAINKPLPISTEYGLFKTIKSFKNN